ncbi:small integral membrane protein 26-like isoform 1-T1 [Acanthopagrus schlegelii]
MTLKDVLKWKTRMSIVYAAGVWTVIGSYAYFKYTGQLDGLPVKSGEVQEPEDPNQVVYETAHSKTVVIYKKDFVPYTTRIYNFIKSFSGDSRSGDDAK